MLKIIWNCMARWYSSLFYGFRPWKINYSFSNAEKIYPRPLTQREKDMVQKSLQQPYRYYRFGWQSYTFISEDGQIILKLLKTRYPMLPWVVKFMSLPLLKKLKDRYLCNGLKLMKRVRWCWVQTFNRIQHECCLICVQTKLDSEINTKVTLIDQHEKQHHLDIGNGVFLLQYKADLFYLELKDMVARGNIGAAKKMLDKLMILYRNTFKKGIFDVDYDGVMRNTGLFNGEPVYLDVGKFEVGDLVEETLEYRQEFFNKTHYFRKWLKKRLPILVPYFDKQMAKTIGDEYWTMTYTGY